jgi:hypothetical protein
LLPVISARIISPTHPRDLAIALMILEGDNYSCIRPSDYVSHLQRPEENNNILAARMMNHHVINWAKHSILCMDDVIGREGVLKWFVNMAEVIFKRC